QELLQEFRPVGTSIRRLTAPDPFGFAAGNPNLDHSVENAARDLADASDGQSPRVVLNADGSVSNISPQIDERVLDKLKRGDSAQKPIEGTIHIPGVAHLRGREALKPVGAQEIVNAP